MTGIGKPLRVITPIRRIKVTNWPTKPASTPKPIQVPNWPTKKPVSVPGKKSGE